MTKVYLHDAATIETGTLPGGSSQSLTAPSVTATGASTNRSMDINKGTLQVSQALTTLAQTGNQKNWFRRFVSAKLAAQTFRSPGNGNTWVVETGVQQSNTNSNMNVPGSVIYVWRPFNGTLVGRIVDLVDFGNVLGGTTQISSSSFMSTGGSNVTCADGDLLVVEIWSQNTQAMATAYTNTVFYDGTTEVSNSNEAAYLSSTDDINFFRDRPAPFQISFRKPIPSIVVPQLDTIDTTPGPSTYDPTQDSAYDRIILGDLPAYGAYWKMNEKAGATFLDRGPNDLDMGFAGVTLNAYAGPDPGDPGGNGASLFGSSGNAVIANQRRDFAFPDLNPFSVELWAYPRDTVTDASFIRKFAANGGWSVGAQSDGTLDFLRGGAGNNDAAFGPKITVAVWNHIVATYDGASMIVYANSVAGTPVASARPMPGNEDVSVGIGAFGLPNFYVAKAAVYSTALRPDEVAAHFVAGTSSTWSPDPLVPGMRLPVSIPARRFLPINFFDLTIPTFPVAQTFSVFFEGVQALADTSSEPIEAEQTLAATKSDPFEAIVGGIQQTKSEPFETNLGVNQTNAEPYDALGGLAETKSDPWEASKPLATTASDPLEAIVGGIQQTKLESWEALLGVAATKSDPWDALLALAATKSDSWEANTKLKATAIDSYEILWGVAAKTDLRREFVDDFSSLVSGRYSFADANASVTAGLLKFIVPAGQASVVDTVSSFCLGGFQWDNDGGTQPDDISDGHDVSLSIYHPATGMKVMLTRLGGPGTQNTKLYGQSGLLFTRNASFPHSFRLQYRSSDNSWVFSTAQGQIADIEAGISTGLGGWIQRFVEPVTGTENPFLNPGPIEITGDNLAGTITKTMALDNLTIWSAGAPNYEALQTVASTRSDPWDALQTIVSTASDPWEALVAIASIKLDPWESTLGATAVVQTASLVWEAIQSVSSTNSDVWEALVPLASTKSDAWEALVGIAKTNPESWEALGGIASTKSDAWEALQKLAVSGLTPWEAIVGGIVATRVNSWEALLGIAATKQDTYEALGGIASLRSDVWEATGAVRSTSVSPWEAIVGGIVSTRLNPWEANLAISANKVGAWEALGGIASTRSDPWESSGNVLVTQTASLPWDALKAIAATGTDSWEATVSIASSKAEAWEAMLGLASTRSDPYDALQMLAATKLSPYETLQALVSAKSVSYEALKMLSAAAISPWDALRSTAQPNSLPWDALKAIAGSASDPLDAIIGGISSTRSGPYEALLGIAATRPDVYESLRAIQALGVSSWEATGIVYIPVSATGQLPYDATAGMSVVPALPFEASKNLTKTAPGPYEAQIKVLKSGDSSYETLIGIRNPSQLPLEVVVAAIAKLEILPWEATGRAKIITTETGLQLDGAYHSPNFERVVVPIGGTFVVLAVPSELMEGLTETGLDIGET